MTTEGFSLEDLSDEKARDTMDGISDPSMTPRTYGRAMNLHRGFAFSGGLQD
jgi:hypothetical protein